MTRIIAIACIGMSLLASDVASANNTLSASHSILVANVESSESTHDKVKEEDPNESLPLPPTTPVRLTPAQQYCSSIVDAAAAAQIAQQTENLEKAKKRIEERVALLAAKTAELKSWMKKREEFSAQAANTLVEIYSKMKPEAASSQLTAMDEFTSAAIMSKLSAKTNSLILSEMEATKAARLMEIIAGSGEIATKPEAHARADQR